MNKTYIPPKQVQINAKKALDCIKKGSKAMTRVGRARARQLASGKPVSLNTIKRIYKFKRHKKNASFTGEPCEDRGHVAYIGWGGDQGIEWAESVLRKEGILR